MKNPRPIPVEPSDGALTRFLADVHTSPGELMTENNPNQSPRPAHRANVLATWIVVTIILGGLVAAKFYFSAKT